MKKEREPCRIVKAFVSEKAHAMLVQLAEQRKSKPEWIVKIALEKYLKENQVKGPSVFDQG